MPVRVLPISFHMSLFLRLPAETSLTLVLAVFSCCVCTRKRYLHPENGCARPGLRQESGLFVDEGRSRGVESCPAHLPSPWRQPFSLCCHHHLLQIPCRQVLPYSSAGVLRCAEGAQDISVEVMREHIRENSGLWGLEEGLHFSHVHSVRVIDNGSHV